MSLYAWLVLALSFGSLLAGGIWSLVRRLFDHSPYGGPEALRAEPSPDSETESSPDGMTSRNQ
jgi:hypothetical protein